MDGGDNRLRRRRSLQERLGLACCGSTWGIGPSNMSFHDDDLVVVDVITTSPPDEPDCVFPSPRMNLADALAAERSTVVQALTPPIEDDNRSVQNTKAATPTRMSLMRLLEETDDQDEKEGGGGGGMGRDLVCCVCMGRKKGAAFIPCGHTFCRVCSRELWLNRGSCPLCNRSILEILDIF